MLIMGYATQFIAIFFSVFIHELGHIATSRLFGIPTYSIKILPIGLNASIDIEKCNTLVRILILFAGPCVNLIMYLFFMSINQIFLATINKYLFIFNMIPILPLDGGKILREILFKYFGLFRSDKYVRKISLILACALLLIGGVVFKSTKNFSLVLMGIYMFSLSKSQRVEVAFMNMKHLIYRHSRLLKKGVYPVRGLVVTKMTYLNETLKEMDFDRFHIVYVLNDDLGIERTFTEQEVIDGMIKYGNEINFGEFVNKAMKKT